MTPLRQVRKLEPGERLVVADGRATVERWWRYPAPGARPGRALGGRVGRDPAREARRVGAPAADERRAARRDAERRPRLEPDRRADGAPHERAGQDLLGRLRGRGLRARRRAPRGRLERRRPPRARGDACAATRTSSRGSSGTSTSRWPTSPSLGFLPLCELARERGDRRADRPGRRRAARRLPQAPRGLAGRGVGAGARLRCARARPPRCATGPGRAGRLVDALQAADPVARLLASSGLVHADLQRRPVRRRARRARRAPPRRVLRGRLAGAPGAAPLEAALYLDARLGLVDDMLTYFDRASMACSLEVRVPFLDHELVELCARIPAGAQGAPAPGQARAAARGARPRARSSCSTSASAASSTRPWASGWAPATARWSTQLLLGSEPRLRRRARPRAWWSGPWPSGAAGRRSTRTCCSR